MTSSTPLNCPACGAVMNHHASKPSPEAASRANANAIDSVLEIHTCPACGKTEARLACDS